jgi:hypothetical protein
MGYPGLAAREALENVPETMSPTQSPVSPPAPPAALPPPKNGNAVAAEPTRRLGSAWQALSVIVVGLGLSLLLNAPGIHKTAYNQPDGWTRDVALAVTGPLADVSAALRLDRPRAAVKNVLGRSGDDGIDTEIEVAAPLPPPDRAGEGRPPRGSRPPATPAVSVKPVKPAFTPVRKLRLWIAGDSLVITPGYAILRAAEANRAIGGVGTVDGRVATGLGRPDVFNWFKHVSVEMRRLRPNAVVLAFGANDDKAYMTGGPSGSDADRFGDATWRREYRRRLGLLFDGIARAGTHVVWIGLPLTKSARQSARFRLINAAVLAEARERPGRVSYIDTYDRFALRGRYAEYLRSRSGALVKVRAPDGVHFERAGGEIVARQVLAALNRVFDLTSWKR